jgi:hypothetical protein
MKSKWLKELRMGSILGNRIILAWIACGLMLPGAHAAEASGCLGFKWDVTHEVALMKGAGQPVEAATQPGAGVPELKIDTLYVVKLADQSVVKFAGVPGKSAAAAGARAGLVQFRVSRAGRYRVSITSGHWMDVIADEKPIASVDYQGHTGCERPRKIVEFELPADQALVLQFSGSDDSTVTLAITAAKTPG